MSGDGVEECEKEAGVVLCDGGWYRSRTQYSTVESPQVVTSRYSVFRLYRPHLPPDLLIASCNNHKTARVVLLAFR